MSQAERAKQQLYADAGVRDELTDDEADVLLKWAEGQIDAMAAKGLDDAAFDEAFAHLNHVVTNINRYTGKREYASPQELQGFLDKLAVEAQALGSPVTAEQLSAPAAQGVVDNITMIQSLAAMVAPGETAQAQAAPPTTPPAAPVDGVPAQTAPPAPAVTPPPAPAAPAVAKALPPEDEESDDDGLINKLRKLF